VRRVDDPALALDGSLRLPPDELPAKVGELSRNSPIVLGCT
jgi:hypothetical protein